MCASIPRRVAPLAMLAMLAACASPHPLMPQPTEVREWVIPWADAFPSDVVVDTLGRVWFTARLSSAIGRLDPETGSFERFATPTRSAPYGFVAGPDGGLWYGAHRAPLLGRVDPATGEIIEVKLEGLPARTGPTLLAVQGTRIWFTVRGGQRYGSHDAATGLTRIFATPDGFEPYGIAAGRANRVWISAYDRGQLLEVDAATDSVREHTLDELLSETAPSAVAGAAGTRTRVRERRARVRRLTTDHEGRVWLSDFGGGRVLAFDPRTRRVDAFHSLNAAPEPYGITADRDGRVWYNEKRHDVIIALDPASGQRVTFRLPTRGAAVRHLAIDAARGRVWLPLSDRGRIGMIPLAGDSAQRDG